jgi:hypothetical protein
LVWGMDTVVQAQNTKAELDRQQAEAERARLGGR